LEIVVLNGTASVVALDTMVVVVVELSNTPPSSASTDNRTATTTANANATVSWHEGIYSVHVLALRPETIYQYRVLVPSDLTNNTFTTPATSKQLLNGRFRTPPLEGTPYNFTIALAGCAMTGSRHAIFDTIAKHSDDNDNDPLQLFVHLGDFHYADIATNDMNARLDAIATTLDASSSPARLFRSTALAYMWDDHDWLGNNAYGDSERQVGARETALRSYQVAFPHYPLAALATATMNDTAAMNDTLYNETVEATIAPVSPYHAFTIGTIRFILTDLRSESTAMTMWSDAQRNWFFDELSHAAKYDFVIWVSTKPWIGPVEPLDDAWYGVPQERSMVSDYISQTIGGGLHGETAGPQNLLVVAADAHMLAFDNGTNTYYGTNATTTTQLSFPILQSGPLDRPGSVKGGPYTDGCTAVLWERNHHYSTIAFEVPPLVDDSGNIAANRTACMVITGYDTGAGSSKSHRRVVFIKRLCGKIFASSSSNVHVGTCHASRMTVAPKVLSWVALVLVVLCIIGYGMVYTVRQTVLMAMLMVSAIMLTAVMGLLLTYTMGYEQFDLTTTLSIILFQAIAMGALVMFWVWSLRRKQSN
jgi:phosphodiesterase/alkaline phosphatase D-like protein